MPQTIIATSFCVVFFFWLGYTHLTVASRENGSQDLPVLLHLLKLPLQDALHVCVGLHVFHHILLQDPPQSALVGAIELEPK